MSTGTDVHSCSFPGPTVAVSSLSLCHSLPVRSVPLHFSSPTLPCPSGSQTLSLLLSWAFGVPFSLVPQAFKHGADPSGSLSGPRTWDSPCPCTAKGFGQRWMSSDGSPFLSSSVGSWLLEGRWVSLRSPGKSDFSLFTFLFFSVFFLHLFLLVGG